MLPVRQIVARLFAHERPLFWTGLLGIGLGGVCVAGMAFHGAIVEPEGNLFKAATFDIAVGLFLLTLALVSKAADFTPRGRAIWRWTLVSMALFGYGVETIQIFRGLDPRFSRAGTPLDGAVGGMFFLSANVILVCFVILMARFFWMPAAGERGPLVLALRYGAAASLLGFGVGNLMSVLGGPRFGDGGNLLPLHAAGFHGLQAVPLVALLLMWARVPDGETRRAVHFAGVAWLGACLALAWQTLRGLSVLEPSFASAVAALVLGAWALAFLRAVMAFRRSGSWPDFLVA